MTNRIHAPKRMLHITKKMSVSHIVLLAVVAVGLVLAEIFFLKQYLLDAHFADLSKSDKIVNTIILVLATGAIVLFFCSVLRNSRRKPVGEMIIHILISLIFMAVAVSYLYILVWAFLAGCKDNAGVTIFPFKRPQIWHWENYKAVFDDLVVGDSDFWDMLFNSCWFSVGGVLIQQFVSITFAYCCSKYKFPGSKLVYPVILVMITLPIYGTSGALYRLLLKMNLIDSYAQIITSAMAFNMFFLYYTAFFKNLSWTFAEAAMVDGANDFTIYFRVMLPQAKPIFGALFLTQWITIWNSYDSALIYLPNLPTLPVGIYQFYNQMVYAVRMDILFAACVIISIPALILFIAFNKIITTNVSVGGIKG